MIDEHVCAELMLATYQLGVKMGEDKMTNAGANRTGPIGAVGVSCPSAVGHVGETGRTRTVPEMLAALAQIYEERGKVYGDDYKNHGKIMVALFPNGLTLKTVEDFNRYSCFKELITKTSRYAPNFIKGGHVDSLDDISVYSQMLQELDNALVQK